MGKTEITVERGELRIDVKGLVELLGDEQKKEVAKLIGADEHAWKQMAEALVDPNGFYNKEDGYGDWWFSSEAMLEIRQKLLPAMSEIARLAVVEALEQRDHAKADADRHQRWAWAQWHARPNPYQGPRLPEWAHPDRAAMQVRDAAPELLAALEMAVDALKKLAPYSPEVAEGVFAIVGAAEASLAKATKEPEEFRGLSLVPPAEQTEKAEAC